MKPPISDLTKEQIVALHEYRCKHGHTGLVHFNCYQEEQGFSEKVCYFDIESSNLDANYGIMLTWANKPAGSKEIEHDSITKEDLINGDLDKRIVISAMKSLHKYDRIVGHYSRKFDIPFLRTRAMYWHLDELFPKPGELAHTDTWELAKTLLKLNSNRQVTVAEALIGNAKGQVLKTRIDPNHWIKALQGDEKALAYILDHNIRDVIELERNHKRLQRFARKSNRSI